MHDKTVRRRRAVLALLVASSLILLTAYFGESAGGGLHAVQRGVFGVISPIQDGASRALKPVRDLVGWVGDTFNAKGENKDLRKTLDQERRRSIGYDEATRQNVEFRKLLGMDQELDLDQLGPVMARVSGTSPTVWYRRITINKGTADGVRVDQPVITGSGLVGKVETAVGHSAVVMLLTDSAFNAGAKVSETGVTGVIQPAVGSPGRLVLQYTTSRDQVTENEKVVTQGTDSKRFESLFPKDIPIGYVTKVDEPGTDAQVVHVRPYVDVRRLDYVQVLTKKVDGNR